MKIQKAVVVGGVFFITIYSRDSCILILARKVELDCGMFLRMEL
jgi:hypothetical protein